MHLLNRHQIYVAVMVGLLVFASATAQAQSAADSPWSAEAALGFDNSIAGNINSSAIGQINGQTVVITKNTYDEVYGTGLHLKFGGGYMVNELTELRANFAFQTLSADLTPIGEIGAARLYGQYTDYQSFALDVGVRRYREASSTVRTYGEGTVGLGFVDKTDMTLVAPQVNFTRKLTDFYDQTVAFTLGGNVGVLVQTGPRIGFFGQVGIRYVTGMASVDDLVGTGLESINDKSGRWTMPLVFGVRARF